MKKYTRFIKDQFASDTLSRNELNLFTAELLGRLAKIVNPALNQVEIDKLKDIHTRFVGEYSNLAIKGAVQLGGTISREDAYDDVIDFIKQQEGAVKAKFGKNTAQYVEFYPAGTTEYHASSVEGLKILLSRYVAAATKYKTELGANFLTEITALETAYTNARDEQVDTKSANKTTQAKLRSIRKELTLHLTKCLLLIAAETLENENDFLSYFNFGLLEVDNDNSADDEKIV
ncbi:MAG: hypothetical protein ACEQSR_12050 [Candidatus Methylacidiphilales bacterium]